MVRNRLTRNTQCFPFYVKRCTILLRKRDSQVKISQVWLVAVVSWSHWKRPEWHTTMYNFLTHIMEPICVSLIWLLGRTIHVERNTLKKPFDDYRQKRKSVCEVSWFRTFCRHLLYHTQIHNQVRPHENWYNPQNPDPHPIPQPHPSRTLHSLLCIILHTP